MVHGEQRIRQTVLAHLEYSKSPFDAPTRLIRTRLAAVCLRFSYCWDNLGFAANLNADRRRDNAVQLEAERVAVHESFEHNPRAARRQLEFAVTVKRRRQFPVREPKCPIQSNASNLQLMHAHMRSIGWVKLNRERSRSGSCQAGYVCTSRRLKTGCFKLLNRGVDTINRRNTTHIQNRHRAAQPRVNNIKACALRFNRHDYLTV